METITQLILNGQRDLTWFESNIKSIKMDYNNRFIAICNKNILESDANLDNLMEKLNKKGIDTSNVIIRFISKIKSIL